MAKRIGIITFHAPYNYGSSLQNYALQHVLRDLGFIPETINLRTARQKELYDSFRPLSKLKDKKRFILNVLYTPYRASLKTKAAKYEQFISSELCISKEVANESEIKQIAGYDGYIVGSDQCWNIYAKDFDWSYYMDFVPQGKPKISYAISMGPSPDGILQASNTDKEHIKNALNSYTAISTRDERTCNVVKKIAGENVDVCINVDPTLLLSGSQWEERIDKEPIVKGKYIFLYNPYYLPMVYDTAKKLSKITGLKVVVSNINPKSMISSIGFEKHLDAGPWEFLNLVKNAEYVVGRSFHLLVFSILLEKKFIAVEGMGDSRLNNLLSLTGLQKYATVNGNIEDVLANHSYLENDYKVALDRIHIAYDAARQYLLNNLESQV